MAPLLTSRCQSCYLRRCIEPTEAELDCSYSEMMMGLVTPDESAEDAARLAAIRANSIESFFVPFLWKQAGSLRVLDLAPHHAWHVAAFRSMPDGMFDRLETLQFEQPSGRSRLIRQAIWGPWETTFALDCWCDFAYDDIVCMCASVRRRKPSPFDVLILRFEVLLREMLRLAPMLSNVC